MHENPPSFSAPKRRRASVGRRDGLPVTVTFVKSLPFLSASRNVPRSVAPFASFASLKEMDTYARADSLRTFAASVKAAILSTGTTRSMYAEGDVCKQSRHD